MYTASRSADCCLSVVCDCAALSCVLDVTIIDFFNVDAGSVVYNGIGVRRVVVILVIGLYVFVDNTGICVVVNIAVYTGMVIGVDVYKGVAVDVHAVAGVDVYVGIDVDIDVVIGVYKRVDACVYVVDC